MRTENDCNGIDAQKAVTFLKALSNEKRLQILCKLLHQEMCVNEMEKQVNLSQSALSQHLAKLRASGLVKTRRSAQTIFYSVKDPDILELMNTFSHIFKDKNGSNAPSRRAVNF
ncbi:MAG TPA: metalloregulator ArsR/SmtB family transcription factor [Alphaproteobacteria bacterium]|nr:winged helix-turn-helix transcriptional regulator [Alphaproteobacteria bacterium]HOO51098.1 metalloregulator ArsR/SmtB family transcription factor [Alphaproteobacteria bacterium]